MRNVTPTPQRTTQFLTFIGALTLMLTLFTSAASAAGYDGSAFIITAQAASGCMANTMSFNVTTVSPRLNQFNIRTPFDVGETPCKVRLKITAATKGTLYVDDVWLMVASNVKFVASLVVVP